MKNALLLLAYLVAITGANVALTFSAHAQGATAFLALQAAGNIAGFLGILAYTGLLTTMPLHVAFPVSRGVAVIGVQVIASILVFHERFRPTEIAGTLAVAAGVLLVGTSARGEKASA